MSSLRAQIIGYDDTPVVTDRVAAAVFASTAPVGTINPYNRAAVTAGHYTSPLVRAVVSAGIGYGFTQAAGAAVPSGTTFPSTTAPLSSLIAPSSQPEPSIFQPPEAEPVSIFSDINSLASTVGGLYQQYQNRNVSSQPAMQLTSLGGALGMGALPAIGAIAGTAVRVGVAGARSIASSAMTYCRRHPQWCATIGGSAAVAGLIQGGQLPVLRRRRGRGITPKDLRSFKRVANLIRGFCPTVRRIPTRATRTGSHRHA